MTAGPGSGHPFQELDYGPIALLELEVAVGDSPRHACDRVDQNDLTNLVPLQLGRLAAIVGEKASFRSGSKIHWPWTMR